MKYLVVFGHMNGQGNCVCNFDHDPPTASDIVRATDELTEKYETDVVVLNYMKLSEEPDDSEEGTN